ncbi:hypothetical protein L1887_37478 [Cichorium endivia]|nr:hypothetical protein L1887_37478 [Cichorium endivia]
MEMKSIISFLFLLQPMINVVNLSMAKVQPENNIYKCRNTGNYTTANYEKNLMSALDGVANNIAAHKGFYHSSSGANEPVNAVGLCPGYITPDNCALCVRNSIILLRSNCQKQKEGVTWISTCMVRYSDRKILGVLDDWVWVHLPDPRTVARVREMDQALFKLATRLQAQVAGGSSLQKFAYGQLKYAPDSIANNTLYAAMQCTPDLSKLLCTKCLLSIMLTVTACCSGKVSAAMLSPNCYLRYDHDKFDKNPVT